MKFQGPSGPREVVELKGTLRGCPLLLLCANVEDATVLNTNANANVLINGLSILMALQ